MANIDTYLQQIMAAIYGEDVRGSIHDAIQEINNVVKNWESGLMDTTLTSTTLPAQGKAVGDAIRLLKNSLDSSMAVNAATYPYKVDTLTKLGITLSYKGYGIFHISGTATSTGSRNVIDDANNGLNLAFKPGSKLVYLFHTTAPGTTMEFWSTPSSENPSWSRIGTGKTSSNEYRNDVTIPSNSQGLLCRITFASGMTYDDDFIFVVSDKYPNLSIPETALIPTNNLALPDNTDLNNVIENGIWVLSSGNTYQNAPHSGAAIFFSYHVANTITQIYIKFRASASTSEPDEYIYVRTGFDFRTDDFSKWICISRADWMFLKGIRLSYGYGVTGDINLNDIPFNTIVLLDDNTSHTYINKPDGMNIGFIISIYTGMWRLQFAVSFAGGKIWKRRGNSNGTTWETWSEITGIENIYNNTYEFPKYSETINLTSSPTITADTNNYLAPSGDTTDRSADILAMLNSHGVCRLGPGEYYVKNIVMPDYSSIIGSGLSTKIMLSADNDAAFAFSIKSHCIIKDLRIMGAAGSVNTSEVLGSRHGIIWQGDYTESHTAPLRSILENLFIQNFTGGGISCYDTGYGTNNCIEATNIYIDGCSAGINISYWSEFHKFTNVRCSGCYYGCINNGGNNIFVNCDFSSNKEIAFLMDNSQGQSPNNSHGSCIGCVFNHTAHDGASNSGIGIKILNCDSGFIFSGCQIFFSKTVIEDSDGVVIANSNFGLNNCDVTITGGGAVLFSECMVQGNIPVTIQNNQNAHFVNCYNRTTGAAWAA